MSTQLEGRVALGSGASRGIGRAVALALAREGANVCCAATSVDNAQTTAAEVQALGRQSLALGFRVDNAEEVKHAFDSARASMGPVDILVNNAGIARPKPILEMSEEDWDSHLNINAKSVFLCSQQAPHDMQARGGPLSISARSMVRMRSPIGSLTPLPKPPCIT